MDKEQQHLQISQESGQKSSSLCLLLFLRTISEPLSLQPPHFSPLSLFKSVWCFAIKRLLTPCLSFSAGSSVLCMLLTACICSESAATASTLPPALRSVPKVLFGTTCLPLSWACKNISTCSGCSCLENAFPVPAHQQFSVISSALIPPVAQCTAMDLLFYLPQWH